MKKRTEGLLTGPAVAVSLLPKAVCPICSPAYAALLSSVGLGFIATTYLLLVTVGFLAVALAALVFRASSRRGFGPFAIGGIASAYVLSGKFWLSSDSTTYVGVGLLVVASVWNAIPKRRTPDLCPGRLPTEAGTNNVKVGGDEDGNGKAHD